VKCKRIRADKLVRFVAIRYLETGSRNKPYGAAGIRERYQSLLGSGRELYYSIVRTVVTENDVITKRSRTRDVK
jgi:hypothetical protein